MQIMAGRRPGETVRLEVRRAGILMAVELTLVPPPVKN
jgi:hypothetical protein